MYLDIEKRSEEFAAAVLSVDDNARGPIATAFVCGANEMLEAIEKNHYIVEATRVTETNMDDMSHDDEVMFDKDMRKQIDEILQMVKLAPASRERSLAITKLQEGIMWLGMDLKRLNEPNPYPSSKDPSTGSKIEPTADGLKM
jgi:hypothetical protein